MITSSFFILLALVALSTKASPLSLEKRRFGQENPAVLQEIRQLNDLAKLNNGRFDQIAGAFIGTLLGGSDPCDRYALIDEIVTLCKANNCAKEGIEVAAKLAAVEKNFNPFAGENAKPAFCDDASLPQSAEVRCVVPIIDPAVSGAAEFNQKANARLQAVLGGNGPECSGQSVKAQAIALGISDCVGCPGSTSGAINPGAGQVITNTTPGFPTPSTVSSSSSVIPESTPKVIGCPNPSVSESASNLNVNEFNETLLGAKPVVVNDLGAETIRRFQVLNEDGSLNGDFLNKNGALQRACDEQKNKCAETANAAGGVNNGTSVSDCEALASRCQQANGL